MSALDCLPLPTLFVSFLILKESITEPLPGTYSPDQEVGLTQAVPGEAAGCPVQF